MSWLEGVLEEGGGGRGGLRSKDVNQWLFCFPSTQTSQRVWTDGGFRAFNEAFKMQVCAKDPQMDKNFKLAWRLQIDPT